MLVSYRQPLGHRQPVRVGRVLYGRLLAEHYIEQFRNRVHPVVHTVGDVCLRATRAGVAAGRTVAAVADRFRPRPFSDRAMMILITMTALGALTAAWMIGEGLAQWMMTSSEDTFMASVGAVVVGFTFLVFTYLVFASKQGRTPSARRRQFGRREGMPSGLDEYW